MFLPSSATLRLSLYAYGPIFALFLLLFLLWLADNPTTVAPQAEPDAVASF